MKLSKSRLRALLSKLSEDLNLSDNFAVEHLDQERLQNNTLLEDLEEILDELNGRTYSKDEEKHLNKVCFSHFFKLGIISKKIFDKSGFVDKSEDALYLTKIYPLGHRCDSSLSSHAEPNSN